MAVNEKRLLLLMGLLGLLLIGAGMAIAFIATTVVELVAATTLGFAGLYLTLIFINSRADNSSACTCA